MSEAISGASVPHVAALMQPTSLRRDAITDPLLEVVQRPSGEGALFRQILFRSAQSLASITSRAPGERRKEAEIHVHRLIGACSNQSRIGALKMPAGNLSQ